MQKILYYCSNMFFGVFVIRNHKQKVGRERVNPQILFSFQNMYSEFDNQLKLSLNNICVVFLQFLEALPSFYSHHILKDKKDFFKKCVLHVNNCDYKQKCQTWHSQLKPAGNVCVLSFQIQLMLCYLSYYFLFRSYMAHMHACIHSFYHTKSLMGLHIYYDKHMGHCTKDR